MAYTVGAKQARPGFFSRAGALTISSPKKFAVSVSASSAVGAISYFWLSACPTTLGLIVSALIPSAFFLVAKGVSLMIKGASAGKTMLEKKPPVTPILEKPLPADMPGLQEKLVVSILEERAREADSLRAQGAALAQDSQTRDKWEKKLLQKSSPDEEVRKSYLLGFLKAKRKEYVVLKKLGSGGQGDAYLLYNIAVQRLEVLKISSEAGAGDLERSRREAVEMDRISHLEIGKGSARIPAIYSADISSPAVVGIIIQYIPGISLMELVEKTYQKVCELGCPPGFTLGLPIRLALELLLQDLLLLKDLAPYKKFHRDSNPNNYVVQLLAGIMRFILNKIDLGTIKQQGSKKTQAEGVTFGLVPFVSPEQLSAPSCVDVPSEIWSSLVNFIFAVTHEVNFFAHRAGLYEQAFYNNGQFKKTDEASEALAVLYSEAQPLSQQSLSTLSGRGIKSSLIDELIKLVYPCLAFEAKDRPELDAVINHVVSILETMEE